VQIVHNPAAPFTYFHLDKDGDDDDDNNVDSGPSTIAIGVIYNSDRKWSLESCRVRAKELHKSGAALSHLTVLNISSSYAGSLIQISSKQVDQMYPVIQAFVSSGAHVYCNDGTQVTFDAHSVVNHRTMLERLLKTLNQVKNDELLKSTMSIPFHRSAFWTSPLDGSVYTPGVAFAAAYRERNHLADVYDAKHCLPGESIEHDYHQHRRRHDAATLTSVSSLSTDGLELRVRVPIDVSISLQDPSPPGGIH